MGKLYYGKSISVKVKKINVSFPKTMAYTKFSLFWPIRSMLDQCSPMELSVFANILDLCQIHVGIKDLNFNFYWFTGLGATSSGAQGLLLVLCSWKSQDTVCWCQCWTWVSCMQASTISAAPWISIFNSIFFFLLALAARGSEALEAYPWRKFAITAVEIWHCVGNFSP